MELLNRLKRRLERAARQSIQWYTSPIKSPIKRSVKGHQLQLHLKAKNSTFLDRLSIFVFGGEESYRPLHKRIHHWKTHSFIGRYWDAFLMSLSIFACVLYVVESYVLSYDPVQIFMVMENIVTQFFLVDFIINFFGSSRKFAFIMNMWTAIDVLTIAPTYVTLFTTTHINLSVFRFVRILRLIRILRMFKLLRDFSGVHRQIITISLSLASLVFIGAGLYQLVANESKSEGFACKYINEMTHWEPSCSAVSPATDLDSCDCQDYNCKAAYEQSDRRGRPSGMDCSRIDFFQALFVLTYTGVQRGI